MTDAADGTVAVGHSALAALTSGARNMAIGYQAADSLTTSADNLAIGYNALTTATTNTTQNVAIGNYALNSITAGQTVTDNTAIGYHAGNAVTTGDSNTLVGMQAGNVITTGGTNTIIGKDADPSANSATNQIVIGANATGVQNNSVTLGNADITNVFMGSDSGAYVNCSGIAFPATQVASGGANALDDYEEGTWTPTDVSGESLTAAATAYGIYTKIGNVVHIKLTFSYPSTSNTSTPRISLPFAAGNDNINDSGTYHAPNNSQLGDAHGFGIRTNAGASYVELIKLENSGDAQNDDMDGMVLNMQMTYWV